MGSDERWVNAQTRSMMSLDRFQNQSRIRIRSRNRSLAEWDSVHLHSEFTIYLSLHYVVLSEACDDHWTRVGRPVFEANGFAYTGHTSEHPPF